MNGRKERNMTVKLIKALRLYTHTHVFLQKTERRKLFYNFFFSIWSKGGIRSSIGTSLIPRDLIG